jgi:hypothetical protein
MKKEFKNEWTHMDINNNILSLILLSSYKSPEELGAVAHACNPSTLEVRQENQVFKGSLGYIGSSRPLWAK